MCRQVECAKASSAGLELKIALFGFRKMTAQKGQTGGAPSAALRNPGNAIKEVAVDVECDIAAGAFALDLDVGGGICSEGGDEFIGDGG